MSLTRPTETRYLHGKIFLCPVNNLFQTIAYELTRTHEIKNLFNKANEKDNTNI
jgi:hypothetical protein